MTIEQLLDYDAQKLLDMTDDELLALMAEPLTLEPRLSEERLKELNKDPKQKAREKAKAAREKKVRADLAEVDKLLGL